jgi:site-specific DNA-methyltransferase (adenine-specific)
MAIMDDIRARLGAYRTERIGDCLLVLGDCLEVLPLLEGGFDAICTDPPFGTEELGGGYGRRQIHTTDGKLGRTIKNDKDLNVLRSASQFFNMKNGYALIFYSARKTKDFIDIFSDNYYGEIIWNKKQMGLGYTVRYQHESIAVIKYGENPRPNFPICSVLEAHQSEKQHPHQKPISLMATLVQWQDGVVLDPFMGSGTTLAACAALGRQGIGIEIDPDYFDIAVKRIREAYSQPDIFIEAARPKPVQGDMLSEVRE